MFFPFNIGMLPDTPHRRRIDTQKTTLLIILRRAPSSHHWTPTQLSAKAVFLLTAAL